MPLFVRWPARFKNARVVEQIVAHIDIAPTLLELCGIEPPAGVKFDGRSLLPLLAGNSADWPERTLYTHNPINETNRYPGAVRTQKYRLVRELRGGAQGGSKAKADRQPSDWQLYNMQADPSQTKNLAAELPAVVADLTRQYEAWFDDISSAGLRRFPVQIGHVEEDPVTLHAPQAYFDGGLKFFAGPGYAHDWLTGWSDVEGRIWFETEVVADGEYDLTMRYTCPAAEAGSRLKVSLGDQSRELTVPAHEPQEVRLPHRDEQGHERYVNRAWGELAVGSFPLRKGAARLSIECLAKPGAAVMDFKGVTLERK